MQTLLIRAGRSVAIDYGWYNARRLIQTLVPAALLLVAVLGAWQLFRREILFIKNHAGLIIGLTLILIYCLLRAADINHVELFGSGHSTSGFLWPLEAFGLSILLFGSARAVAILCGALAGKMPMDTMSFRLDRFVTLYVAQPCQRLVRRLPAKVSEGVNRNSRLPILMYHSISDDVESDISAYYRTVTSPSQFIKQMHFLKENGYQAIALKDGLELLKRSQTDDHSNAHHLSAGTSAKAEPSTFNRPVVLTFDDGFRDFYTTAWPSLQQFGFSATIYLSTRFISNGPARFQLHGRDCLTWSEVEELFGAGVEVGSHTVSHAKLKELPWSQIESEVFLSKYEIEERINSSVTSFAYPYAFPQTNKRFAERFQDMLRSAGYSTCVTTEIGSVSPRDNPYRLRRLPVNDADDSALLGAKLEGAYNWLSIAQQIVKHAKRTCGLSG